MIRPAFIYADYGIYTGRVLLSDADMSDAQACILYQAGLDPADVPDECWAPLSELPWAIASEIDFALQEAIRDRKAVQA